MNIGEEQLKALVMRILKELEAEKSLAGKQESRQKLYMLCGPCWDGRYMEFLREMEYSKEYDIYPVIPSSWQKQGHEEILKSYKACRGIIHRTYQEPEDLETAVTVFPVVNRNTLVKTALCISDTLETSWIARCIEKGSRVIFLRSGLNKFSGMERPAYKERIMTYHRQVLEYGIDILDIGDLSGRKPYEATETSKEAVKETARPEPMKPENGRKRVITSSNIEQLASDGILHLQQGDIVTDIAKDRAKFLKIVFE